MAQKDLTIEQQLALATKTLLEINAREKSAAAKKTASAALTTRSSRAPAGSLSAALVKSDGLLGQGRA